MLSDERIAELADKYYSPVGNTKYIEQAIKDALAEAAQVPKQDLSVCQYTAPKRIHLCVSDDEADHNRAFCDGFEPHDVTWAEDAPIAVCVEYVRADLAVAQVPVMGEAVAWTSPPLYRAPATCITQAELDAMRKDEKGCRKRYRILQNGQTAIRVRATQSVP